MTRKKTMAVLTGGGDVPGLNPTIKQVVNRAIDEGWRVRVSSRLGRASQLQ